MNKIALSLIVLAALSTASFASQRSTDPEVTLGGKALSVISSSDYAAGSAFAIDSNVSAGNAFDRLEMNADNYQLIR